MNDDLKCKDCFYLRSDVSLNSENQFLSKIYGKIVYPCNRYPMNILRAKNEPACGEFQAKIKA